MLATGEIKRLGWSRGVPTMTELAMGGGGVLLRRDRD
jgi:hypothetical protein